MSEKCEVCKKDTAGHCGAVALCGPCYDTGKEEWLKEIARLREENKTLNEWNECLRGENSKCCDENEKLHEMCNEQTEHQVVMLKREALLRAVAEAAEARLKEWTRETYIGIEEALKAAKEGGAL